jgi:phage shock protein C
VTAPVTPRPLRRSRRHRIVAGVCGGLAEWRGWNPTLVRIGFVLIGALPVFPGILAYLVLWLLVPLEEASATVA